MRKKCRTYFVGMVLMIVGWVVPLWAQGHCAKVSTKATFYFGVGMETTLPDPNHPITVDLFHTDLELSFRPTGWAVRVSHDEPGSGPGGLDIPPQDALLYANSNSQWLLPSIPPAFEFIGAKPGEPFWILPQNAQAGVLSLGLAVERADSDRLCTWNPNDPRGADTADRWFAFQLLDVRGPADANFAAWQADGIHPPVVFMSTQDGGITADDVYYISNNSHVHMNWGFTQPGLYEIDFRVSTVMRIDEALTADWAPPGDGLYYGDGHVDLQDFAWMAAHWMQTPFEADPNTFMFVDPNDPNDPVNINELEQLIDQWLLCGYPGCTGVDANETDPNELN